MPEELHLYDIADLIRKEKGDVSAVNPYVNDKQENGLSLRFASGSELIITSGEGLNGVNIKMRKMVDSIVTIK